MITLSIDVNKIDKSRFKDIQTKNGPKRVMDLTLIETKNDKYGNDYFVTQSTTKEERQQGIKLPILGNGKQWEYKGNARGARSQLQGNSGGEDW